MEMLGVFKLAQSSSSAEGEMAAGGEVQALVIDNGSGMVKAGISGDPRWTRRLRAGRRRPQNIVCCLPGFSYFVNSYLHDRVSMQIWK